jgi:hypothetical protein
MWEWAWAWDQGFSLPSWCRRMPSCQGRWSLGSEVAWGWDLGAWAWDHASGCPAPWARDAAMVIKVLRSVWRASGTAVRDSRFTARSS